MTVQEWSTRYLTSCENPLNGTWTLMLVLIPIQNPLLHKTFHEGIAIFSSTSAGQVTSQKYLFVIINCQANTTPGNKKSWNFCNTWSHVVWQETFEISRTTIKATPLGNDSFLSFPGLNGWFFENCQVMKNFALQIIEMQKSTLTKTMLILVYGFKHSFQMENSGLSLFSNETALKSNLFSSIF